MSNHFPHNLLVNLQNSYYSNVLYGETTIPKISNWIFNESIKSPKYQRTLFLSSRKIKKFDFSKITTRATRRRRQKLFWFKFLRKLRAQKSNLRLFMKKKINQKTKMMNYENSLDSDFSDPEDAGDNHQIFGQLVNQFPNVFM